ncbi:putative addiction module killer protein [Aminobacter niigataensis]|uniref:Addiction module killer protein n=1 Tax=Aminobacter niigataensis TaxID=83265 RepID=A0ABR6L8I4_9HYPH|nr:type II toxin-antitoxin system RelE/ParE family toxin [Aminobacter niigataensis]MBB4653118.1 putative addiction module killer protein [Aminobacter niigataensis]
MFEVRQTDTFRDWIDGLRDLADRRKVAQRVVRLEAGLFGDVKFFDGIGELRVNFGPGYRVYFVQSGRILIILLCGGDKSNQARDIKRALELAKEV